MQKLISLDELVAEIQKLIKANNLVEAIKICTDAITLQPLNADFYQQRAIIYMISGQIEKSRKDTQTALTLSKTSKLSNHFLLSLIEDVGNKEDQSSTKSNSVDNTEFYKKMTLVYLSIKHYDEVIKYGNLAEKENIANDEIFVRMAMAYTHLKQYNDALRYFTKALSINTNNYEIYYLRSNTYLQMIPPRFQLALEDINKLIQTNKTHSKAYATRAYILFHMDKFKDAKLDCIRAIKIDENNAEAFYTLARCHYALKSFIQSVAAGEVQLSIDPKMVEGYCICAMSSYELGQFSATIEFCDKGLKEDNHFAIFFQLRSCAKMSLGDYDEAIIDYKQACLLYPDNQESFLDRFQQAKLHYERRVIKFIETESKNNDLHIDKLIDNDRILQFNSHEKNMLTIVANTKCNDYIHHVFTYCLAELYAKCQWTYLCKFGDETVDYDQKDQIRIEKSARYYINVLNGLLNNSVISPALKANSTRIAVFNLFKQLKLPVDKNNGLINKCIEALPHAELIQSQKINFLINILLGINQLYVQSPRATQYFKEELPVDFKTALIKCLNQALKELLSDKEAEILWQHLDKYADNIFNCFNITMATQQQTNKSNRMK